MPLSGGMKFLNGFGLSTSLRDGEGIVIRHNRLHERAHPFGPVRVRDLHGMEKGNPFREADVGRYSTTNKDTPTNASAECDGIDGSSRGGRQ